MKKARPIYTKPGLPRAEMEGEFCENAGNMALGVKSSLTPISEQENKVLLHGSAGDKRYA